MNHQPRTQNLDDEIEQETLQMIGRNEPLAKIVELGLTKLFAHANQLETELNQKETHIKELEAQLDKALQTKREG